MDWIKTLYSDVIPWLLEPEDPSVRYWTLTRLLGRAPDSPEAQQARRGIAGRGPAAELLGHYAGNGRWEGEQGYYTYKYTSTHWQLLLLAELAADGTDERIAAACQRMIRDVYGERRTVIWPCFYGNLIGYLHALGHGAEDAVQEFTQELARASLKGKWGCPINGDLPCAWGVARALWGFARILPAMRTPDVEEAIESGVRFLGRYRLRDGNYPTAGQRSTIWDHLNFPLFYQADVLFVLRVLADLGRLHDRPAFGRAVMWLEDRCRDDGRWNGSSPYRRRMWTPLERSGRPSKWVTWQALYVLKTMG